MKKLFSLMLALLMMALPVFSLAEGDSVTDANTLTVGGADVMSALPISSYPGFSAKYLAEGQREETTITLSVGDALLMMLGGLAQEGETPTVANAISDVADALAIVTSCQAVDDLKQGSLHILLSGEDAANLTVALSADGAFASSNVVGDDIYFLSTADLKALIEKALKTALANSNLTDEQIAQINALLNGEVSIEQLIGNPDFTALSESAQKLIAGMTLEEVTEAPEALPDATSVITLVLAQEDLKGFSTELVKVLWSIPVFRQFISLAQSNGTSISEEQATAGLSEVIDKLTADPEIKIYMNADSSATCVTAKAEGNVKNQAVSADLSVLTKVGEDAQNVIATANVTIGDNTATVVEQMDVVGNDMTFSYSIDTSTGDTAFRPLEITGNATKNIGEKKIDATLNGIVTLITEPSAAPIAIEFASDATMADLDDHAEADCNLSLALKDFGELFAIHAHQTTDLAEAYIANPDIAVQPAQMSEEEQSELMQKLQTNLQTSLITVMQKLPSSVLMLMYSNDAATD